MIDDTDAVIAVSGEISLPPIPGTIEFDSGWAVFATAGYAFDNHWRLEGELGYRANDTASGIADVTEWSIMLNALYDIPISRSSISRSAPASATTRRRSISAAPTSPTVTSPIKASWA